MNIIKLILLFILICSPSFADVSQDGVDDYIQVTVSSVASLRPSPDMTACIWSKRNGASESFGRIISVAYDDADSGPFSAWAVNTDNTSDTNFLGYYAGQPGLTQNATSPTYNAFPNTTDWHYICMRTTIGTFVTGELLVDGVVRSSITTIGALALAYDTRAGFGELYIGCDADDTDNCTNHTNADFTYWNSSVPTSFLLSVYLAGKGRFTLQLSSPNIILNLPLSDCADGRSVNGWTFRDNANANNGTSSGGTCVASTKLTYPE